MLKNKAINHTNKMEYYFNDKIWNSVNNSTIYKEDIELSTDIVGTIPEIELFPSGTIEISAIAYMENKGSKIAALNFANYYTPGGGFIDGCMAQEEACCHQTNLYNVLSKIQGFYENHRNTDDLHKNEGIYTPNIIIDKDEIPFDIEDNTEIDIISVAAPNYSGFSWKYKDPLAKYKNEIALKSRIRFVLDIAQKENVDVLILGAFGCGVFGQNPTEVAKIFRRYLTSKLYSFKKIIFAIPDENSNNFIAFKDVFK